MKQINFLKSLVLISLFAGLVSSCAGLATAKLTDSAPGTTGNAQSLIRVTSDPIPEFFPQISPDGKKIIFHTRDDNKSGNEQWSVVMMNIGSPGRIPLIGSYTYYPTFYPDSKTIAYSYLKPSKSVIARSMTDGSAGINYVGSNSMGDSDAAPRISPDGKKISFFTKFGGSFQLCLMDINGMNPSILTEGYGQNWSPDGNTLVYNKLVGKFAQIFLYDFKTGQSTQITSGEYNNSSPSYSKNGKYITFSSNRDNENEQIFVMKSNGSDITQITTGNTKNGMPIFAPDNTIYFCSNAGTKSSRTEWYSSDIWSVVPVLN